MKFLNWLKVKKNRDISIVINIVMSLLLSFFAVYLDDRFGKSALTQIYIMQTICIINWVIAFLMIVLNIWSRSKRKLEERDRKKGLDK